MEDFFNNQSYNQYSPQFIGEPVEDIKAINKEKQLAYDYVLDKTLTLTDVLNNVKHLKASEDVFLDAKKSVEELQKTYAEDGDYENKILDINKFAQDLAYDKGLKAVQEQYASKENFIAKAVEDEKDNHDISRATAIGMRRTKAVERDEVTGLWNNINFDAPTIPESINWAKELIDVFKGFQSGSIALTQELKDRYGEELQGYFNIVTAEGVTDAEIAQAANAYLLGNNKFKERLQFENIVERENLVQEDGTYRDRTIEDLSKFIPKDKAALEQFLDSFSTESRPINSIEDFNRLAEERGIEETYNHLFNSGYMNTLIEPVVRKEGFIKYNQSVHQDWILKGALDEANKGSGSTGSGGDEVKPDYTVAGIALLSSEDKPTPIDMEASFKAIADISTQMTDTKKALEKAKASPNPDNAQIRNLENELATAAKAKRNLENKTKNVERFLEETHGISLDKHYVTYSKDWAEVRDAWVQRKINDSTNMAGPQNRFKPDPQLTPDDIDKMKVDLANEYAKNNPLESPTTFKQSVFNMLDEVRGGVNLNKALGTFEKGNPFFYHQDVAKQIKSKGGITDAKYISDVYTFVPQEGSKYHADYKGQLAVLEAQFMQGHQTFYDDLTGKTYEQLIDEDLDVDIELVDFEKTSKTVKPILTDDFNGKQGYVITTYAYADKDRKGASQPVGSIIVNSNDKFAEMHTADMVMGEGSTLLRKKRDQGFLSNSENTLMRKYGALYASNTGLSTQLDQLGIETFKPGQAGIWNLGKIGTSNVDEELVIRAVENFRTDGTSLGDTYFRLEDKNGNVFAHDGQGNSGYVAAEEVSKPGSNYFAHTYSDRYEITETIGAMVMERQFQASSNNQAASKGGGSYANALAQRMANQALKSTELVNFDNLSYNDVEDRKRIEELDSRIQVGVSQLARFAEQSGIPMKEVQINSTYTGDSHNPNGFHFDKKAIDIQATDKLKQMFGVTSAHNKSFNVLGTYFGMRVAYEPPKRKGGQGHFHFDLKQ